MNISELVIYRNLKHEDLFEDMAGLMGLGKEGQKADPFACAGELVQFMALLLSALPCRQ